MVGSVARACADTPELNADAGAAAAAAAAAAVAAVAAIADAGGAGGIVPPGYPGPDTMPAHSEPQPWVICPSVNDSSNATPVPPPLTVQRRRPTRLRGP